MRCLSAAATGPARFRCRPAFARASEVLEGRDNLLAMQKVVGSNPISRLRKGLHLQAFLVCEVG
jgi:hypothetical protein